MLRKAQVRRETRTRTVFAFLSAFFLLISFIFLILVEVATTPGRLPNVYFIKLDLSKIIPQSVPNAVLINTIAQTLGLHDFYQVGLWNYCAGYVAEGITTCSHPRTLYWFNPVAIVQNELLSGASIAFPQQVQQYLRILEIASHWMFGLFLTATVFNFVMIFVVPLSLFSKLASIPITILTLFGAICTTVATVLGTAIFIIIRNALRSQTDLNIQSEVGKEMYAFMWIATGFSLAALVLQFGMCCCCRSRRKAEKAWREGHREDGEGSEATEKM